MSSTGAGSDAVATMAAGSNAESRAMAPATAAVPAPVAVPAPAAGSNYMSLGWTPPRKKCGIDVSHVPRLCTLYMRGFEHDKDKEGCGDKLHCPKEERPPCPLYIAGVCVFGDGCWYPHTVPPDPVECNLAIQTTPQHVKRVADWLTATKNGTVIEVCRAHATNRKSERIMLCQSDDPDAVSAAVRTDIAGRYVRRIYPIDDQFETVKGAMASIAENCTRFRAATRGTGGSEGEGAAGDGPLKVRIQAFPRKVEASLVDAFPATAGVEVTPKEMAAMGFIVVAKGCYYTAVRPASMFLGHLGDEVRHGAATCRAYYKLREAVDRCGVALKSDWVVLDCGASPGGWSQYASEHCKHVYAVDPGELAPPVPTNVEHMDMRAEDAVPLLLEKGVQLDMFVCDMNVPWNVVLPIFRTVTKVLRPGSPVIVTVKSFTPVTAHRERACKEAKEAFEAICGAAFEQVHLFSNAHGERTLVGQFMGVSDAGTGAGAGAGAGVSVDTVVAGS